MTKRDCFGSPFYIARKTAAAFFCDSRSFLFVQLISEGSPEAF